MQNTKKTNYIENELNNIKYFDKNLQIFVLKIRANVIPTQQFLNIQYPNDVDETCKICKMRIKDIKHIFDCNKNKMDTKKIAGMVEENIFKYFNNNKYLVNDTPKINWLNNWIREAWWNTKV